MAKFNAYVVDEGVVFECSVSGEWDSEVVVKTAPESHLVGKTVSKWDWSVTMDWARMRAVAHFEDFLLRVKSDYDKQRDMDRRRKLEKPSQETLDARSLMLSVKEELSRVRRDGPEVIGRKK